MILMLINPAGIVQLWSSLISQLPWTQLSFLNAFFPWLPCYQASFPSLLATPFLLPLQASPPQHEMLELLGTQSQALDSHFSSCLSTMSLVLIVSHSLVTLNFISQFRILPLIFKALLLTVFLTPPMSERGPPQC